MIAIDLDNTLLRSDKSVSAYTASVFGRVREKGVKIAFVTSRSAYACARIGEIVMPDIRITSGGAMAVMDGETVFRAAIDIGTASSIIQELNASDDVHQIAVDTERHFFSSAPIDSSNDGWIDYADAVITDFSAPLPVEDVFKITPNTTSAETVLAIVARYPAVDAFKYIGEDWFQISSREAEKHIALARVCGRLGVPTADVVAFGDDYNDIEMLRECGTGVAVANAIDEVKAVADYVCDSNDNDGVARWIEENLL